MLPMKFASKNHFGKLLPFALLIAASVAHATCWKDASKSYGIPEDVLMAIAKTESNFNVEAKNINKNGTEDIGLMQINSGWLPELAKYDITRKDLMTDACLNLKVGAWILSNNVKRLGWNWDAIGSYKVVCKVLTKEDCQSRRSTYAWKIHGAMRKMSGLSGVAPERVKKTWEPSLLVKKDTPKIIVVSMNTESTGRPAQMAAAELSQKEETQGFFFYDEEQAK